MSYVKSDRNSERGHGLLCEMHCAQCMSVPCDIYHKCVVLDYDAR